MVITNKEWRALSLRNRMLLLEAAASRRKEGQIWHWVKSFCHKMQNMLRSVWSYLSLWNGIANLQYLFFRIFKYVAVIQTINDCKENEISFTFCYKFYRTAQNWAVLNLRMVKRVPKFGIRFIWWVGNGVKSSPSNLRDRETFVKFKIVTFMFNDVTTLLWSPIDERKIAPISYFIKNPVSLIPTQWQWVG